MIMYHMKKQEQKACRLLNIYKSEGRDVVTSLFCCLRFVIRGKTGTTCTTKPCPFFVVSLFLFCWCSVVNGYKFTERVGVALFCAVLYMLFIIIQH